MGGGCHGGHYWDALLKKCIGCQMQCKQPHIIPKCTSYCESAHCKALLGHYYDALLKTCVRCTKICGSHPAECSQHCQKVSFPSTPRAPTTHVTTKKLLVEVPSHVPNSRGSSGLTALEDSTILFYSLLALCMLLLFSSLSLASAVLLRRARAKTSKPGPKEANYNQESAVQQGQEGGRPGHRSKDFVTNSNHTRDREPSNDSIPTETCVCVHCFPDLKGLGQGNDRPTRAPFSFYQQPVLHGGPVWAEENLHNSGLEVLQEAEVG
ncbi:tumor necrosis factor receptor superfamily member 13B [Etheostoma cragini]|uniref:tumor necrosis factor receptor superfamily member 13B n=1 Tax=Etheostoma cragini TaxID=417921 RepID=UPI00155EF381|nr:tumor necrosis factor receptor superfamily member 13B [Etheostoma cragini]